MITADADQQHEVMEDVDDVLAELRGDTLQSSHAHTPNEVLDRLRETLVDPKPSTSEGACNYSLDPETKEYTPRKKAKRNLKNVLDQLESIMYSSTLQSDEESTPQKKKRYVTSVIPESDDEEVEETPRKKAKKDKMKKKSKTVSQ